MCPEIHKVPLSSSKSSSLNSSPSRALWTFFCPFFCPLHCRSSVHGFPHEALPFAYRLECSVFIVALLGGVLEWLQMCLLRWRKFSMCWEVKGVCTRVFLCCCLCYVSMGTFLCISAAFCLNQWNWVGISDPSCSFSGAWSHVSEGLTALLLGYLIPLSWTPPLIAIWETEILAHTLWCTPDPLCSHSSHILSQHLDTSAAIWHWRSRKCPAAVLREQSCLSFENKLRSTSKWCSSNP